MDKKQVAFISASIGTVSNELERFYYVKDHLGSIRVTVDEDGEKVGYDDYDPWGMILAGRSSISIDDARYKFTSKERDVETGYDYFGARYYDSRIGRWLQVDPLSEKYPGWSPYNYTLNNPLIFVDSDGNKVKYKNQKGQTVYKQWTVAGAFEQLRKENTGSDYVSERGLRHDPSFNVQSWETLYGLPYAYISLMDQMSNSMGLLTEISGLDNIRQFLTSSEWNMLRLDEAIFSAAVEYEVDGVKLAKYDKKTKILELSDEMRNKWTSEGLSDEQIEEQWEYHFQDVEGSVLKTFEFDTRRDRIYDASYQ